MSFVDSLVYVEGALYVFILIFVYFYLCPSIGKGIKQKCLTNIHCYRYLQRKQLFGFLSYDVDNADNQWRTIKEALPLLAMAACLNFMFGRGLMYIKSMEYIPSMKFTFNLLVGIICLYVQHKWHSAIIFAILVVGYAIVQLNLFIIINTKMSRNWINLIPWIYSIFLLLGKESYRLLRNSNIKVYFQHDIR